MGLLAFVATASAEPSFYTARVAPIFDRHCTACHGAEKQKGKLRLDAFEHVLRGAESGAVVKPDDVKGSELFRRITLKKDDDEVMPSDGKPLLAPEEIKIIELWIAAGASATKPLADFPTAPVPKAARAAAAALAPDWRPRSAEIAAIAKATGLKLVPRSQVATDGLVVRTASAPARCDDAALAKLAPIAPLIVEAELARTKVTDAGLKTLAQLPNLRYLDLTRTAVTSEGLGALGALRHLEALNLTETAVDGPGLAKVKAWPALKRVWSYGSKADAAAAAP
ncbi:MAG: hypothetical protein JNL39_10420 [Opitutaceae bacterium]|nr:hypothetical protein [Opitutaceae bacterium]